MEKDKEQDKLVDRLWAEIDGASVLEPELARSQALEAVIDRIDALPNEQKTASVLYLQGYAWYFHPNRRSSVVIQEKLESALHGAVAAAPDCARAWMYLGHNAYDLGRYEEARQFFETASPEQLGSYWRMKLLEMRICCRIVLGGLSASLGYLEDFVCCAEQVEPEDVWPVELAKWVKDLAGTLGEFDRARLQRILDRLDRAGHWDGWFSSLV